MRFLKGGIVILLSQTLPRLVYSQWHKKKSPAFPRCARYSVYSIVSAMLNRSRASSVFMANQALVIWSENFRALSSQRNNDTKSKFGLLLQHPLYFLVYWDEICLPRFISISPAECWSCWCRKKHLPVWNGWLGISVSRSLLEWILPLMILKKHFSADG